MGVDTRDLREISVTRVARSFDASDIEQAIARALERRNGLGETANLALTFDRTPGDIRLDAANSGALSPIAVRFESRNNRFDVTFETSNDAGTARSRRWKRPCWRVASSAAKSSNPPM